MQKEIITLNFEGMPVRYYVSFGKGRKKFSFQPTLSNKSAPAFTIHLSGEELILDKIPDETMVEEAKQKIRAILSNDIYNKLGEGGDDDSGN